MSFSPATIANFFLEKASQEGRTLTPMQVIKLTYIAHGWHLGYFHSPLINEQVEAWRYGPVIGSLYHCLKQYRNGAVQAYLPSPVNEETQLKSAQNTSNLLNHVWSRYSKYNGPQLSTLTHQPETPWSRVWGNAGKFAHSEPIPDDLIKSHYCQKIQSSQSA